MSNSIIKEWERYRADAAATEDARLAFFAGARACFAIVTGMDGPGLADEEKLDLVVGMEAALVVLGDAVRAAK